MKTFFSSLILIFIVGNISAQERTTYDYTPLDSSSYRMGSMEDLERTVRNTGQETFDNASSYYVGRASGLEDFGNSKYDRDYMTSMADVENRSLHEIREERKEAEIKSILSNIVIGVGVVCFVIFLIGRSNNHKSKSNEINK